MPVCDICNKGMEFSDGYALPTELVTTSEEYWLFMLNRFIHDDEEFLASSVQLQAKQRSGWLVCESCSKLFAFDRHQAKEYATRQTDPPGGGPANVSSVAAAAAKAWKKLHGKWPSWVRSEPGMEKAGAGARFVSFILDGIILFVISCAVISIFIFVSGVESTSGILMWLLISMGYFIYFFGNGQTLGMKAMKIKLCGADGTYPIGYGKGFLRWIGLIISTWVIYLGFLWILIDENKQGWHDKIASTYVVLE